VLVVGSPPGTNLVLGAGRRVARVDGHAVALAVILKPGQTLAGQRLGIAVRVALTPRNGTVGGRRIGRGGIHPGRAVRRNRPVGRDGSIVVHGPVDSTAAVARAAPVAGTQFDHALATRQGDRKENGIPGCTESSNHHTTAFSRVIPSAPVFNTHKRG
jgi:hypothetical protein